MGTCIPAFHVSDASKVDGSGEVFIANRQTGGAAGVFAVKVAINFNPLTADLYPTGVIQIDADLNDSVVGTFIATSIESVDSHGRQNPTVYLTGRCRPQLDDASRSPKSLRYWLMIANNRRAGDVQGTPDVVGFAVHDHRGARIAYGTGPVRSGDFSVAPK